MVDNTKTQVAERVYLGERQFGADWCGKMGFGELLLTNKVIAALGVSLGRSTVERKAKAVMHRGCKDLLTSRSCEQM